MSCQFMYRFSLRYVLLGMCIYDGEEALGVWYLDKLALERDHLHTCLDARGSAELFTYRHSHRVAVNVNSFTY